MQKAAFCGK